MDDPTGPKDAAQPRASLSYKQLLGETPLGRYLGLLVARDQKALSAATLPRHERGYEAFGGSEAVAFLAMCDTDTPRYGFSFDVGPMTDPVTLNRAEQAELVATARVALLDAMTCGARFQIGGLRPPTGSDRREAPSTVYVDHWRGREDELAGYETVEAALAAAYEADG